MSAVRSLRTLAGVALIAVPMVTWAYSTGALRQHLTHIVPDGQYLYLLSKLVALIALIALWFQLTYGLLGANARARLGVELGIQTHRALGLTVLALVASHAALFVAGVTLRTGHMAWQYVIPSASDGYYRTMISVGILAGWLLVSAVIAGLTRRAGRRGWRVVHSASYVAAVMVAWHSLAIGTESRIGAMPYLYAFMAAGTVFALVQRLSSGALLQFRLQ